MSEEQKQKIQDVMHTLACIQYGRDINAEVSAEACWDVLQEVLDLEATHE
jgi:hypothetical protein